MELTLGFSHLIYGIAAFVFGGLALEFWLELNWSRQAQTMHAKPRK